MNVAGVSNWESFVTGTHPNDPDGALRLIRIRATASVKEVSWISVPYASYRVETSTNLLSLGDWVPLGQVFTGPIAAPILYIDTTGTNRIQFYRLMYEPN